MLVSLPFLIFFNEPCACAPLAEEDHDHGVCGSTMRGARFHNRRLLRLVIHSPTSPSLVM